MAKAKPGSQPSGKIDPGQHVAKMSRSDALGTWSPQKIWVTPLFSSHKCNGTRGTMVAPSMIQVPLPMATSPDRDSETELFIGELWLALIILAVLILLACFGVANTINAMGCLDRARPRVPCDRALAVKLAKPFPHRPTNVWRRVTSPGTVTGDKNHSCVSKAG